MPATAAAGRLAVPAVLPAPVLTPAPPVVVILVPVVIPVVLRVVRVPVVGIILSVRRRGPGADAQRCGRDERGGHQSASGTARLGAAGKHVTLLSDLYLTVIIYTLRWRFIPAAI